MDIPLKVYCKKFRREETVWINIVNGIPFPNICDDGDGSEECLECLKIAVEKHLQEFSE